MSTIPVIVSTEAPDGGPAVPIAVVSDAPDGGPALPIVEVADGRAVLGQRPVPVCVVADGRATTGQKPMPVVVMSGTLNPVTTTPPFDYTLGGTLTLFAGFIGWRPGAFWQDAAQTVAANVGDPIESWREIYSGANRHATQLILAKKPTVVLTATGKLGASFDAVDDALQTAAFAAVAQPTTVYSVAQRTSSTAANRFIHEGRAATNRHQLAHLSGGAGNLQARAGVPLGSATGTALLAVCTVQFSGATSQIWLNGTLIAGPGDAGPHSITGVTLGAHYDLILPLGGNVLAYLGYPGTHSAAQRNAIIAALTLEAGV